MADYAGTIQIGNPVDLVFDYLSDVTNLPAYFARMTEAHPTADEEVHTTATLPDGHRCRATRGGARMRCTVGSSGEPRTAVATTAASRCTAIRTAPRSSLHLHTPHDEDPDVHASISDALHSIKNALETSPNGV